MLDVIYRNLRDLASIRMQHRFIRDATKDNYLLPEELLADADSAVRLASKSTSIKEEHRQAIEEFRLVLDSVHPDLSIPNFFDVDPDWVKLREAAKKCLIQLGFDLASYEDEEIGGIGA
jgi:hypothetical protein